MSHAEARRTQRKTRGKKAIGRCEVMLCRRTVMFHGSTTTATPRALVSHGFTTTATPRAVVSHGFTTTATPRTVLLQAFTTTVKRRTTAFERAITPLGHAAGAPMVARLSEP